MEEYPVRCGEKVIGTVRLSREGGWVHLEMDCEKDPRGLFRGFLLCRWAEIPLGVLEPKEDRLRLYRRIPAQEIERRGGAVRGEMRLSYAFRPREGWQRVENGAAFFQNGIPSSEKLSWEGAMWRREGERRLLAMPYDSRRPFPLCALFCFARITAISGRWYAVFIFDTEEQPMMP